MPTEKGQKTALELINFINSSPTASHAAAEVASNLESAGFKRMEERDRWNLLPDQKGYVVRSYSAILAFRMGTRHPSESGFRIIGAHTDFPGLRLKPNALYHRNGYIQLGVEIYGGPILATWTDRDLCLAGRAVVQNTDNTNSVVLVHIKKPLCRIPNVAIHMNREVNEEGLKLNKQDNIPPVISLGDDTTLEGEPLKKILAETMGVDPSRISDFMLEVIDTQAGSIGGMNDEFVFCGRIDNLASCYAAMIALIESEEEKPYTRVIALFDSEEVGSQTLTGARSSFLDNVLERMCFGDGNHRENYFRALDNSFLISADGAHGLNPNYVEAHDPRHQPVLNRGPVLKVNAQESYTTQIDALAHLRKCADHAGVNLQAFSSRSDKPAGGTIGPMTASRLGIKSVDIGIPIVSMHSIREMTGVEDESMMIALLKEHFSI